HGAGPAAQHRDGIAAVAGGPQAAGGAARCRGRLRHESRQARGGGMMALKPDQLRGSIPPLVTPFKDGAVDTDTFRRLVERPIAEGSHGVLVTGTTGEPSTLPTAERIRLLEVAVKVARGRVPVVAAPGGQSHADTVEMMAGAEKAGVDAMLVVTPYFL